MIRRLSRRQAIAAALGLPLAARAFAEPEFWNQKKSADWTAEERAELLHHSPWARQADVKFYGGPGMLGGPYGYMMGQPGEQIYGVDKKAAPTKAPEKFTCIVRWESSLAVREAARNKLADPEHYILSVTGGVPMLGRHDDESDDEYQTRLENLKQYTRLEKHGGDIYLVKVDDQPGKGIESGTRFYFPKSDPISVHEGAVTFVTRLGPIDVKCKFPLKEMLYRGKLEL